MPSRRAPLAALLLAALAPAPALAQYVIGSDINAAGERDGARAPLFVPSAGLPDRGRFGVMVQAVAARQHAENRLDGGDDRIRLESRALNTTTSAWVGAASWLTLGAYFSVANADEELTLPTSTPPTTGEPTRRGVRSGIGSNEIGAQARLGLWSSRAGGTRLAAVGRVRDRADSRVASSAGLALQQRAGRATVHLSSAAWFADGADASYDLGAALAVPVGARTALTGELLHAFSSGDARATELAGGARWRLGRVALDVGGRWMAAVSPTPDDFGRASLLVATHVGF